MNAGVLASGGGTNLQALIDSVHGREVEIVGVVSDRPGVAALDRAQRAGIEAAVFERADYPDRPARDAAIADWLDARGVALVVLAGYMALLDAAFIGRFRNRILNVHPSLLPKYPGLDAVGQAIAARETEFGVTVHLVDEGMDTGPVILQKSVSLPGATDPAEVLAALRPLEHSLLPEAVRLFARGDLSR